METLAPAPACRHSRIRVETSREISVLVLGTGAP